MDQEWYQFEEWGSAEEARLKRLAKRGIPGFVIGKIMKRTEIEIHLKGAELGIFVRPLIRKKDRLLSHERKKPQSGIEPLTC